MPKLILQRMPAEAGQPTRGSFMWEDDGKVVRHLNIRCLELPWHNNAPQISCIPEGTYRMTYTMSNRFKVMMWGLNGVPDRAGVRIHSGNYAGDKLSDSEGCILPCGQWADINKDGVIDGTGSKDALAALLKVLAPYQGTGIDVRVVRGK